VQELSDLKLLRKLNRVTDFRSYDPKTKKFCTQNNALQDLNADRKAENIRTKNGLLRLVKSPDGDNIIGTEISDHHKEYFIYTITF
jgi:hypothetical protein